MLYQQEKMVSGVFFALQEIIHKGSKGVVCYKEPLSAESAAPPSFPAIYSAEEKIDISSGLKCYGPASHMVPLSLSLCQCERRFKVQPRLCHRLT